MNRKHIIGSLVFATLCAVPSIGCVVRGGAYVRGPTVAVVEVEEEPPPPRVTYVQARPGFIWVEGRWNRRGNRWVWGEGRWERERVGYRYAPGRWERRGRSHVWVEGRWNSGGNGHAHGRANNGPAVRDHRRDKREEKREDKRDNGPVIRDHRR